MSGRRWTTLGAAALLAGAIAAGVAYATIPGPGDMFTACVTNGTGAIRLIDKSLPESSPLSRCKPTRETEVSWNQSGPQGLQGIQGDPGAPGADGANGVSVTSEAEPSGGNCAAGGAKFTAASGVTYACNGAAGPVGASAPASVDYPVNAGVWDVPAGGSIAQSMSCPAGKHAIGGAWEGSSSLRVIRFAPSASNSRWDFWFQNTSAGPAVLRFVQVVCL